jgi:hypothetical protein
MTMKHGEDKSGTNSTSAYKNPNMQLRVDHL